MHKLDSWHNAQFVAVALFERRTGQDYGNVGGLANGVAYGLVAGVYTQDISRALRLAREIQAGQVWINDWAIGGVLAPFGGYKDSGLGREKGVRGLMNYVQIRNVGIRLQSNWFTASRIEATDTGIRKASCP